MIKILHFADAHIDIAQSGRPDSTTGLSWRVQDFLRSLDCIIDAAIAQRVDLVIFAGDAYRDRTPAPTYQREWGRRIMRLSKANIQTLLLVGNHDVSPSVGRATSLQEYDTLEIPNVRVIGRPAMLGPDDLGGVQAQVLAIPWISRSYLLASRDSQDAPLKDIKVEIEETLVDLVGKWLNQADPTLPMILTAHGSVATAQFGAEREVMLGDDFIIPLSIARDARLDYVALGHIHKNQDLNPGKHPPVIYPGSIERVNTGESADEKFYILAEVSKGHTDVQWMKLPARKMFVRSISLDKVLGDTTPSQGEVTDALINALPSIEDMTDAIVRLNVEVPKDWLDLIDRLALSKVAEGAKEFRIIPTTKKSLRPLIPHGSGIEALSRDEMLELYFRNKNVAASDIQKLMTLAQEILSDDAGIVPEENH